MRFESEVEVAPGNLEEVGDPAELPQLLRAAAPSIAALQEALRSMGKNSSARS